MTELSSHVGSVVAERDFVRVLGTVVHVSALGDLSGEDVEENAEEDALPQRVLKQVKHLVVYAVELLQPLQVVFPGGRVRDRPQAQVVHVT